MSELKEFPIKNNFEYTSFLVCQLLNKIERMEAIK